jgi:hypothetical protein
MTFRQACLGCSGNLAGNMMPDLPDPLAGADKTTAKRFAQIASNADVWFKSDAIGRKIVAAMQLTGKFLIDNRQIVEPGPKISSKRPWYDNRTHFPTTDYGLLDARRSLMRQQLFAYGLTHLAMMLVDKEVVSPIYTESDLRIDRATDLASEMTHLNMIHWDRSGRPAHAKFNLRSLMPAYLYAEHGDGNEVRDNHAIDMVCLGLWTAQKVGREWKLSSGLVARLFHCYLYEPVAQNYDRIIESDNPSFQGALNSFKFPEPPRHPPFDVPIPAPPDQGR